MVDSIAKSLGAGSGIDITALVSSLVDAQFEPKTKAFAKRDETLTSQVSAVAQLKSGITGFATALSSLVKGGTLATQPTSSNTAIVKTSPLAGARLSGLSATVEVRALAAAQVAASGATASGAHIGSGSLTLKLGSYDDQGAFAWDNAVIPDIAIGSGDATLSGIAARINAANAGVTASVLTDAGGERLVIKGATGAAKAFTLTANEDPGDPGLSAVNVGPGAVGMTSVSSARDAQIVVDGVTVHRATNTVTDLIPGVKLDLQSAATGTKVAIGATPATAALTQAVNDFVTTYNELFSILRTATDPKTGVLARDNGANAMMRAMQRITLTDLTGASDGSAKTLAEIGVATNRDGSLSVDGTRLAAALNRDPRAVEAMFADGAGASGNGLAAALNSISLNVTSTITGIGASALRYSKAQSALTDEKERATDQQEMLRTRLTQQFASMDSRVAAYKSTQTFLTNQIAAWNAN